jgi:diguanylate cyclase (GGDEF)-like protein
MPTGERFAVTAEIVSAITSSLVLEEVLASVARRTAEALDLWECDIYDYDAGENRTTGLALWARAPHPSDGDWVGSSAGMDEQPSFERVLHARHMIENRIDDPELPDGDRARMEFWGEKSCLLVPLIFKDQVMGCLELVEKRCVRRFSDEERELSTTLAALAAVAIQNARLYGDAQHLAITDGLTGLYNHRYFYERLAQDVARARRYELPLSLLMIDIDDFKTYNDRFGHRAGDALLHELAGVLESQTRQQVDLVARYGGEEFVVILPSTSAQGAARAGERLRDAVTGSGRDRVRMPVVVGAGFESDIETAAEGGAAHAMGERIRSSIAGATFGTDQAPPVITVSIGVASLPGRATTADSLVDEADVALYRAKRLGKNRVEVNED